MEPLLSIENLQIDFSTELGRQTAVQSISFELNRGETLAIVGESGSGKSVSALSILQLLPPKTVSYPQGKIWFSHDGQSKTSMLDLGQKALAGIRGKQISMIFQEPMTSLNPVYTVGSQVMEAIRLHEAVSAKEARHRCIELFGKVHLPQPEKMIRRFPHQLSGGQKQRVMIAMAMSVGPSLLICDEPTTALDVTVQKAILDLIKEWQQSANMGVIFITHDLGVVKQIADRVLVMHKGVVLEEGSIKQIFQQPAHPYTKGLLACRPALQPKGKRLPVVSDFWNPEGPLSTPPPVGPAISSNNPPRKTTSSSSGQVLMKVDNISVWYPGRKNFLGRVTEYNKAVDELSFDVLEGETLGLVGESGCGKSTLGRCLLNLIQPHAGKILYKGSNLSGLKGSSMKDLRREMQIVFQDPYSSLNPRMKIGEAIAEPLMVHRLVRGKRAQKDRTAALLEKVGLSASHLQRYPHEFSGGQRQRIVIARALALNPSFLVCDESVSALDVSVQAQVLNLLNDLKKEYGFTIIFISHDLSVVRYISDRIMVMRKGKIVESGEANAVYESPQSEYTRQLLASVPAW